MNTTQLPEFVTLYEDKMLMLQQLKQEITQLKPSIIQWLDSSVPNRTLPRQNGALKLAEIKTRAPLNKKHLSDSLTHFMAASHQQLSKEQLQQFVHAAVQYIYQSRLETTATKLLRTYNRKKRKATENLMNQIIDSD